MKQTWELYIEDFAKIKEATIKIAPFMVFVGENNSGKSYIMNLLWGVLAIGRILFSKSIPKNNEYKVCEEFVDDIISKESYELQEKDFDIFVDFFNIVLKDKKNYLLKQIFSIDTLNIKELQIKNYTRKSSLKIVFIDLENEKQRFSSGKDYIKFPIDKNGVTKQLKYKMIQYITWKLLMEDITTPLYPYFDTQKGSGEPLFLPASRTGFMLTYKSLASDIMNAWGWNEEINSKFTLPIIKFLQNLIQQKRINNPKYKEVIEFLQKDIIDGQIITYSEIVNEYRYKPTNLKKELPMYVTSSLVSELSPLLIFLHSNLKYKSLFIEEIEAHLHPKIQRLITQVIIRLVNNALPVIITTHSDVVLQQINNMIKLYNSKRQEELLNKYNYTKKDILNPDDIKAYQFISKENKTTIEPLKLTKSGFETPQFNKALIDLANETMDLEDSVNE